MINEIVLNEEGESIKIPNDTNSSSQGFLLIKCTSPFASVIPVISFFVPSLSKLRTIIFFESETNMYKSSLLPGPAKTPFLAV